MHRRKSGTAVPAELRPGHDRAGDNEQHEGSTTSAGVVAPRWWVQYATRVLITDAAAIYIAVFTAYVIRFDADGSARVGGSFAPSYLVVSIVLMWAWIAALVVGRSQDRRVVGTGPAEYQRVVSWTWRLFATVAVIAYLLRMDIGRGYLAIALPLGLGLLLVGRLFWRHWLRRRRAHGGAQFKVLVVGHRAKAEIFARDLQDKTEAGFGVVGLCVPESETGPDTVAGVPVLGAMTDAASIAQRLGVDAVTVVGSDSMTSETVRTLGWDLEGTGIDLALTVALRDVAGPRVITRPVNGLPLVYVDEPHFTGFKYVMKTLFDFVGALLITLVLSPVLVAIALLVKFTSPGAIFYRQERIGVGGKTFGMLKFRSMVADAHLRLDEVLAAEGIEEVGLFYKPKNDPRVTKVGRVLRKYSLDELPQLFNVLLGTMSLVGPRPQIDREVALYDRKAHRRLLVKPGLTGLWQTSGRSELSPEEGIRMDVYYVENWTLIGDVMILLRTARAVVASDGAY
ncbi:sugar transferase [Sanguibacter antarcticus]|nr:sugar transferase [Sanguibacter antarcticus]